MLTQQQRAQIFHDLHRKDSPVVLYNIWDAGSAKAVAEAGAQAIATGSHGVANALGYEDGEQVPLELVLENVRRVMASINELPLSVDFETGYGVDAVAVGKSAARIIAAGVVGINLEDQLFALSELRPVAEQAARIAAIRQVADEAQIPLFINARTDMFKNTEPSAHNLELLNLALERAEAYAAAGASGFFVPALKDIALITQLCERSPLPVNIIMLPGTPPVAELVQAGVSRISYGPVPYLQMIDWLKNKATHAFEAAE